jgi:hypothetical protein
MWPCFFSPKHYHVDELDKGTLTEQQLKRLVTYFHGVMILLINAMRNCYNLWRCYVLLWTPKNAQSLLFFFFGFFFVFFFGFFGNEWEFMINWPTLILLWQAILVIPTSSALVSVVFF